MTQRLEQMRAYLERLPHGPQSHPACCQKASILKQFLELTDVGELAHVLPQELGRWLTDPLLPSTWLPEATATALFLAVRDTRFDSDDAFVEHMRNVNRRLISGRLYRVLFSVLSPRLLIGGASKRFASLHRGVVLSPSDVTNNDCHIALHYPAELVPRLIARCYLTAFEVACEAAGGLRVKGEIIDHGPLRTLYEMHWR